MLLGKPIRRIDKVVDLRPGIGLGTARHLYDGSWIFRRRLDLVPYRESPARSHHRSLLLRKCSDRSDEGQAGKQGAKQILHSVLPIRIQAVLQLDSIFIFSMICPSGFRRRDSRFDFIPRRTYPHHPLVSIKAKHTLPKSYYIMSKRIVNQLSRVTIFPPIAPITIHPE